MVVGKLDVRVPWTSASIREPLVATLVLLIVIQCGLGFLSGAFEGNLAGPDSYGRLNNVVQLHETGNWFDSTNPRVNPPIGHAQHVTRLLDILIIAISWLFRPFLDFRSALHVAGVVVSPLLHVAAAVALFWVVWPAFRDKIFNSLGLIFVAQISLTASFSIGRPDHHSLQFLFFILSLGLTARILLLPFLWRRCAAAGLISGLAMWVSVEAIVLILVNYLVFGLHWIFNDKDITKKTTSYSLSLLLTTFLIVLIERGPNQLSVPDLDKISFLFVLLFGLISLFWLIVQVAAKLPGGNFPWWGKVVGAAVGGLVIGYSMNKLSPGFFYGPKHIDPFYQAIRSPTVTESQSVFSWSMLFSADDRRRLIFLAFAWFGIALPALIVVAYKVLQWRSPEFKFWLYLLVGLGLYFPLALSGYRWVGYSTILLIPAYAILVSAILRKIEDNFSGSLAAVLNVSVLLTTASAFLFPRLLLNVDNSLAVPVANSSENSSEQTPFKRCRPKLVADTLNDPNGLGNKRRRVLAFVDYGPELLYRTNHSVYQRPGHRPNSGFIHSYMIMSAATDMQARQIIQGRQVDLILICPGSIESGFYKLWGVEDTFYDRLATGSSRLPEWIEPVALPDEAAESFKLFQVLLPK